MMMTMMRVLRMIKSQEGKSKKMSSKKKNKKWKMQRTETKLMINRKETLHSKKKRRKGNRIIHWYQRRTKRTKEKG